MWRRCKRGAPVWVQDVSSEPPVGEIPQGVSPRVLKANGGHGPQTSAMWYMSVPTHWGGASNVGTGGDWGIYFPPPEHGCTIHFDSSYHILVSGGGSEAGNVPIQATVGADRPEYPGYKVGACSR